MTNFIQLVPSSTLPTQYFVSGSTHPLFIPTTAQTTVSPPSTQATATQGSIPSSMIHGELGEGRFFHRPSTLATEVACTDVTPLDSQFPNRPTCTMPYHPDAGISRVKHSENTGCKFYVACPARIQGTYNTSQCADTQVKGFCNGRVIAVHTWAEAQEEWATACLRWHGPVCPNACAPVTLNTHVHLNPALHVPPEQELAFAAAAEKDLHEIHILGSTDEARLIAWAN
ncbi:hypothetical protein K438DRAFT_1984943 [Mycena galopus ATCC 62051]|nr:hypothetical protein K438DRAFT_1984943 [Mycena galopus ATCC 62051]